MERSSKRRISAIGGLVVIVLALSAVAVGKWRQARQQQKPQFTYSQLQEGYVQRSAQLPRGAVLLLGDSHVQDLCEACLGRPALNFGIGGDTVDGLQDRIEAYPGARHSSNIAVVEVGGNDVLWHEGADAVEAFPALLGALSALQRVYVYAIFPVASSSKVAARNSHIAETNRAIESECKLQSNCVFVDLKALYTERGFLQEDMHGGDGIHLNAKGYAVWLQDLREKLAHE